MQEDTQTTEKESQKNGDNFIERVQRKLNVKEEQSAGQQTVNFDINKLTEEQIRVLQAKLASVPHKVEKGKDGVNKKMIRLRRIDGKIVSDFKNAYNSLVDDPENQRKVYRHVIPIRFFGGADEYTNILYSDFINAEQVWCEVVSERKETEEVVVGETFHRESGKLVEMVERKSHKWYTIKLPSGEIVEISARLANA